MRQFYYGCNSTTPIYGVELDPATMKRIGALIQGQPIYVRVDAFGKTGITHGTEVIYLP